jgi:hypothetical protein
MKQIVAFKMKLLYLYGALLYAVLAVVFIFSLPDIGMMAKNANQFLVDGQVKLYWVCFSVLFYAVFSACPRACFDVQKRFQNK